MTCCCGAVFDTCSLRATPPSRRSRGTSSYRFSFLWWSRTPFTFSSDQQALSLARTHTHSLSLSLSLSLSRSLARSFSLARALSVSLAYTFTLSSDQQARSQVSSNYTNHTDNYRCIAKCLRATLTTPVVSLRLTENRCIRY